MSDERFFSPDYATARRRFRNAAAAAGFRLDAIPFPGVGPYDVELAIDVAWKGAESPSRAVVVSSGTHGVEGYFGSAVQLALLDRAWRQLTPPKGTALVLVHAVNPYGFAWVRRVNEDNIDLNRNFLLQGQDFAGAEEGYRLLDGMLNPPTPPAGFEAFLPRAGFQILKHGFAALKAAVAVGQYDFPKGLFYGGAKPAWSQQALAEKLPGWFGKTERVMHIDLHTGMGKWGTYTLASAEQDASDRVRWLKGVFGADNIEALREDGVLYPIRGVLGSWLQEQLPNVEYHCLLAEFGTRNVLEVIAALREENRAHHYANVASPEYAAAKERLMEAFAPSSASWRRAAVTDGVRVAMEAVATLHQTHE